MLCGGKRTLPGFKVHTLNSSNQPLITVITVVYNGVDTLEETMLSVLNQSYENIEYIIIDGGSTDGTLDIIRKYEDHLTYWQSEKDEGIYYAMNKGIDLAKGEWINFMNSGDSFYSADVVEKVFYKPQDADVIYGDTNLVWAKESKIEKGLKDYYMPSYHQSIFVKTSLMKQYHYDLSYKLCADRNFFNKIYKEGKKFSYVNEVICNFDKTNSISSNNYKTSIKEILRLEAHSFLYCLIFYHYLILRIWLSKNIIRRHLYK